MHEFESQKLIIFSHLKVFFMNFNIWVHFFHFLILEERTNEWDYNINRHHNQSVVIPDSWTKSHGWNQRQVDQDKQNTQEWFIRNRSFDDQQAVKNLKSIDVKGLNLLQDGLWLPFERSILIYKFGSSSQNGLDVKRRRLKLFDAHIIDIKRLQGYILLLANINLFDLTITLLDHLLNLINTQDLNLTLITDTLSLSLSDNSSI